VCVCDIVCVAVFVFYVAMRFKLLQNTTVKLVFFEWLRSSRKHTVQPNALGSPSNFHASSASDVDTLRSSFSMSASSVFLLTQKHTIGCIGTVRTVRQTKMSHMMLLYTELGCLDARHAEAPMCFI
jgi:hypothetical protein